MKKTLLRHFLLCIYIYVSAIEHYHFTTSTFLFRPSILFFFFGQRKSTCDSCSNSLLLKSSTTRTTNTNPLCRHIFVVFHTQSSVPFSASVFPRFLLLLHRKHSFARYVSCLLFLVREVSLVVTDTNHVSIFCSLLYAPYYFFLFLFLVSYPCFWFYNHDRILSRDRCILFQSVAFTGLNRFLVSPSETCSYMARRSPSSSCVQFI